ncbi:hypothetical protein ACIBO4_35475 [Streptomyces sp. NPDC050149]|uniref:hypothetical protein n=1 Tax=Streptomyces sp. NPDC050149 TaxID=3365603 RepID=UPI0037BC877E
MEAVEAAHPVDGVAQDQQRPFLSDHIQRTLDRTVLRVGEADAATTARAVSAVMFLAMAASVNVSASVDEIVRDIREQIAVLLTR